MAPRSTRRHRRSSHSGSGTGEPPDELPSWFVIKITAIASLGGCLFGYDLGAISGALPQLTSYFQLEDSQQEWIVSILYLGGGLGAAVGGTLCDQLGRKTSILGTDIVFMIGATWLYFANSYEHVLWGRFVVGIAIAVSGIADVSYLHEIAPKEWRGAIVSANEACISLGFLLAYVAGYAYSGRDSDEEWRIIFGWAGVVALIQFIGMYKMPESPLWLSDQGRIEEARLAWLQINSGDSTVVNMDSDNNSAANSISITSGETVMIEDDHSDHLQSSTSSFDDVHHGGEASLGSNNANSNNGGGRGKTTASSLHNNSGAVFADKTFNNAIGDTSDYDNQYSQQQQSQQQQQSTEAVVENYHNSIGPISSASPTPSIDYGFRNSHNTIWSYVAIIGTKLRLVQLGLSRYHRQVIIALFLAITQQLCGQTNVLNYAPSIFEKASSSSSGNNNGEDNVDEGEFEEATHAWAPVVIGIVKFLVTVLVIWRIEFIGRRVLLISGMILIAVGQFALIVAFGGSKSDDPNTWTTNLQSFHLALPGVLLVVCGYSISFGPLTWLLTSELFPTDIRGRALGASTIITYLSAAFVTRTFLSAQSVLGPAKVFAIYCIITSIGVVFAFLAIPDTGEKSADQVEEAILKMYWWKYGSFALSQNEDDDGGGGMVSRHCPPSASSGDGLYKCKENASSRLELVASNSNLKTYDHTVV